MEQVNNGFIEQLVYYAFIFIIILVIFIGIKKVVMGVKQNKKWAKRTAVLLIILLTILLIGGFIFYLYAMALGEAFSTGL